jgi:hypothetical protein
MAEETEFRLEELGWRRFSSEECQVWLIIDGATGAVVHELGLDGGIWVFYHLVAGNWVLLLECGPLRQAPAEIRPRFVSVLGYAPDNDQRSDCVVVVETWPSHIWWLFYAHRRSGGVVLLFTFYAPMSDMVRDVREWSTDEESDDDLEGLDHPFASRQVYDI